MNASHLLGLSKLCLLERKDIIISTSYNGVLSRRRL